MIKAEQGGSFYDGFAGNEAPTQPSRREEGWQANRENMSEPYVNRDTPKHEPVEIEQKDESKLAYWRMFTNQMPKGSFEQSVNIAFGGREAIGGLFREKKVEYITLYKKLMEELK
jgi:hypothetical protein